MITLTGSIFVVPTLDFESAAVGRCLNSSLAVHKIERKDLEENRERERER